MRQRNVVVLAATLSALPAVAGAQAVSGPYVSLGIGANFLQDKRVTETILSGVSTPRFTGSASFDTGFAGVASAGWGFGNGLRVEIEGNYRSNSVHRFPGAATSGGFEQKYGVMGNVLYDMDLGGPITPYVGVGIGEQTTEWRNGQVAGPGYFIRLQHPDIFFAYQAIIGAAVNLPVPGLSLTAEYRFLGTEAGHIIYGQYFIPGSDKPAEARFGNDYNHSLMLGVRYAFNAAPPPPAAVPVAPAAPPVVPSRTYLVPFDWNRADLTARARQIIGEVAQASTRVQVTRIEVNGYTDQSGTARYNRALSTRRADAVAAELVRDGVPRGAIATQGLGEDNPLVPTADGVRELQNRRVEIVLR